MLEVGEQQNGWMGGLQTRMDFDPLSYSSEVSGLNSFHAGYSFYL